MPAVVGLHGPVYVTPELVERAKAEVAKLAIRIELGDKIGALETIGYLLLKECNNAV